MSVFAFDAKQKAVKITTENVSGITLSYSVSLLLDSTIETQIRKRNEVLITGV